MPAAGDSFLTRPSRGSLPHAHPSDSALSTSGPEDCLRAGDGLRFFAHRACRRSAGDDARSPGVGITAAHIGVFNRVTVLELDQADGVRLYVNPHITWFSKETMSHTEGSVSMPGATDEVTRPRAIRFRYQDAEGAVHEDGAEDFLAICIQHEVDQLDGIFWLQRLSRLKRDRLVKRWEKAQG